MLNLFQFDFVENLLAYQNNFESDLGTNHLLGY